MKRQAWWSRGLALVAAAVMAVPMPAMAGEAIIRQSAASKLAKVSTSKPTVLPAAPVAKAVDVALNQRGEFTGQVVDAQGKPQKRAVVAITNGRQTWKVISDQKGNFTVEQFSGGSYRVQVGNQMKHCRVWQQKMAPPSATNGLLVVSGDKIVRGQAYCGSPVACGSPVSSGFGGMKNALTHPLVVAGAVAAAIAIPIAIHNSDDDDDAS